MWGLLYELQRKNRIIDQMLSMHSVLRDRLRARVWIVETGSLVLAALVAVLTFFDAQLSAKVGVDPDALRVMVGLAGVALLLGSLVALKANLHRRQQEHLDATKALGRLKSRGRTLQAGRPSEGDIAAFLEVVDTTLEGLTPIPESQFVKLKALHKRKVRISKFLDRHPSTFPRLIVLRFWFSDTVATLLPRSDRDED